MSLAQLEGYWSEAETPDDGYAVVLALHGPANSIYRLGENFSLSRGPRETCGTCGPDKEGLEGRWTLRGATLLLHVLRRVLTREPRGAGARDLVEPRDGELHGLLIQQATGWRARINCFGKERVLVQVPRR